MKPSREIVVKSPANIAFIKYWGQRDTENILPFNDSFSMNLSNCYSLVRLFVVDDISIKELYIKEFKKKDYKKASGKVLGKIVHSYVRTKKYLGIKKDFGFRIYSENFFPKKAGIASSASFFSALALAFTKAFGVSLSKRQLSVLARLSGSGSACRSIPDGFVWWHKGKNSESSYASSIAPVDYWDLVDLVLVVTYDEKKTSSGEGHPAATTSPFFPQRIGDVKTRLRKIKKAFIKKDFAEFGRLIEEDTLSMHFVMMTQVPPLYYWSGATMELMKKTVAFRETETLAYYTIDAGENIHIICQKKDEKKVYEYFRKQKEVREIIRNDPAIGTRVI